MKGKTTRSKKQGIKPVQSGGGGTSGCRLYNVFTLNINENDTSIAHITKMLKNKESSFFKTPFCCIYPAYKYSNANNC